MAGKINNILSLVFLITTAFLSTSVSAADEYDYIVVGSGPGGGPLAANLAKANYTVLLLDAGDQSTQGSGGQYPPQITWDFFVKHYEDQAKQMKFSHLTWRRADGSYWVGRDNPPSDAKLLGVYYPRGATVGGSSMINEMCTFLPPDSDWNNVAEVTGDASWNATEMRRIFMTIEKNGYLPKGTPGHGFTGYFETGLAKPTSLQNPGQQVMQAVAKSIGADVSKVLDMVKADPNYDSPKRDQTEEIVGLPRHVKANGQRYSARDYIVETLNAKYPLTLSMNSLATRVLFGNSTTSGTKPRATGIEYMQGKSIYKADARYAAGNKGVLKQATARKEVIISGGAFNSPQLLMLSGIGPKDQLNKFKIPVLVDSPGVGNNLMDNQEMPVVGQVAASGSGNPGGVVMLKTKHAVYNERDILVFGGPFVFRGFWPSNQTNRALPNDPAGVYGMSMVKQHPQNHLGYVRLASADPQDMPDINFNHFAEGKDTDMGAMKDVIAWGRKVYGSVSTPTGPVKVLEPPCAAGPDANGSCGQADEDWITAQTFGHHPTSTCAIGGDSNPNAVLDSKFRVRGVDGLRVVDASAFPRMPGVFPVVATFMLSQKATETLLQEAKSPKIG
ncbi:choline dehydrogenase [Halenospora varia]|nr:choline dehydrogenase [Halenospora varia]